MAMYRWPKYDDDVLFAMTLGRRLIPINFNEYPMPIADCQLPIIQWIRNRLDRKRAHSSSIGCDKGRASIGAAPFDI